MRNSFEGTARVPFNPTSGKKGVFSDEEKYEKQLNWLDKRKAIHEKRLGDKGFDSAHADAGVVEGSTDVVLVKNYKIYEDEVSLPKNQDIKSLNYKPKYEGFIYKNKADVKKKLFLEKKTVRQSEQSQNAKKITDRLVGDILLRDAGFSQQVIDKMSPDKKQFITNKILDKKEKPTMTNSIEKPDAKKIEGSPAKIVGWPKAVSEVKNSGERSAQLRIKSLNSEIGFLKKDIDKLKQKKQDTSDLEKKLETLEVELVQKESVLDFYDAGLGDDEIKNLSGVDDYVNYRKNNKYLKTKGFNDDDFPAITKEERNLILSKGLSREEFAVQYSDNDETEEIKTLEKPPEVFRGGEKDLGLSIDKFDRVNKIDEELLRSEAFLKDAESKGETQRAEFYRKEIDVLKTKLAGQMGLSQKPESVSSGNSNSGEQSDKVRHWPPKNFTQKPGTVTHWPGPKTPGDFRGGEKALGLDIGQFNQSGKKENVGTTGRFLHVLGYSESDIEKMSEEDRQIALREQITKEEWFKNHTEVLAQEDAAVNKEQKEEERNIRVLSVRHSDEEGLDVHVRYVSAKEAKELLDSGDVQVDMEDLNKKIEEQEEVIKELRVVDGSEKVIKQEEKELEDLEALKQEALDKPKNETPEAELEEKSDYEERKDILEKNGWSKEEYEALTKEEQDHVYWKGVKEEEYSRNKTPEENNTNSKEYKEETVSEFVDRIWKTKNESGGIHLQIEDEDFYNKNRDLVDKEIARRNILEADKNIIRDSQDLEVKGVSPGAKEFIKSERVLAEEEKERQKFAGGLEKGYENFDKNRLIEIAKVRGIASGGDKQQVIDRLIEDDIKNNRDSFGFANSEISKKLGEYNMSEKAMLMISPEFFALSSQKQMYLLSKIEQKIYLTADLQSKDKNEQEIKGMGFLKKAVATFGKDQRQVILRDKMIAEIKTKGLSEYGSDITTINSYLLDAPDLKYVKNERGRLVPEFQYMETNTSNDRNLETVKNFFNVSASRFGEIPYEWSLKTATNSQKDTYRRAYESYVSAKSALSKTMLDNVEVEKQYPGVSNPGAEDVALGKYKDAQREAMLTIRKADAGVNFGRYITQNPEMEKLTSTWAQKILGTDLGNWGRGAGYAAAGLATKYFGRTMAVTGVGVLMAGAAGWYLADRKKRIELEGKERTKRYGESSDQVLALEAAIEEKVKEIQKVRSEKGPQSAGEEDRLTNEVSRLTKERRALLVKSGIKENISSENVHERLEKLVNQFEKATDEKSKTRILETIKTRLFVTDEMMRDGRINFGKTKDQTFNQFKLSDLMSKASILVEMNGGFSEQKTKEEDVFESFKQFIRDDGEEDARKTQRRLAALKGAGIAALGFGAGAGIRMAQEAGFFGAAANFVSENSSAGLDKLKTSIASVGGNIYDYLKEDTESISKIPTAVKDNTSNIFETPKSTGEINTSGVFEVSMAGSRGAIGAIDDLQEKLEVKFGKDVPAQYKDLMAKTPDQLAREWGFYKPGEVNESAVIKKGEGFSIDSKGVVRFMGLNGEDVVYKPEAVTEVEAVESERKFFNAGNESSGAPENSYAKAPSRDFDYEKALRAKIDEGYNVVSKEIKPGPSNWYEKPVPTEFSKEPAPNVTSVSEGQDFVPNKEASPSKAVPVAESANVSGKSYEISFDEREGKKYIPIAALSSWNMDDTPVARNEALGEIINSKYHESLKYNLDFDRLAVAQEFLDSGKYPAGSEEYEALQNIISEQKNKISTALRAEDVFETAAPSPGKLSLGGREFFLTSNTKVDVNNESLKEIARKYITGSRMGYSGNMFSLGDDHVGVYEESISQNQAAREINFLANKNGDKLGAIVEEKYLQGPDGKYKLIRVYKLKK